MRAKSLAGKPAIGVEAMNTASSNRANSKTIGDASSTNNRPMVPRTIPRTTRESSVDTKTAVHRGLRAQYEATRPESWDSMTPTDKKMWEESHSYESYLENHILRTADGKDARAQYEATRPESWDHMTPTDKAAWEESHPYTEWLENTIAAASTARYDRDDHMTEDDHTNRGEKTEDDYTNGDNNIDTEAEAGTTEAGVGTGAAPGTTMTDSTSSEHENGKSPATKPPGMPESDWIKSQSHNETSYDGKTLLSKLEHAFDRNAALAELLPPETPDEGAGIEKD